MVIFFFKQKTAYEMRISDWSSDVCSSDLAVDAQRAGIRSAQATQEAGFRRLAATRFTDDPQRLAPLHGKGDTVHRLHGSDFPLQDPALHREVLYQTPHLDGRNGIGCIALIQRTYRHPAWLTS